MSLRPTRPGEPGFQDWKDLADAVDSVGVLGAGCAEADPHEVEREAFYSSLGAYFLPDGSPRLEGDDDSACAQNQGTNTMNTPEFDFTAEQPNRLFEKWWAEQAEYRHRQTGISEARAIWLCSWRAYGEACRAATLAPATGEQTLTAEQEIRKLLWEDHPECCGCPVVGAEYMGQQEQVCCGMPEPALLNDKQIVASLRAMFPEGAALSALTPGESNAQAATPNTNEINDLSAKASIPAAAPQAAPDSGKQERALRRLLCAAWAGSRAYMDDGEAYDDPSGIDFLRDSLDEIERKQRVYGMKKIAVQAAPATGSVLTDEQIDNWPKLDKPNHVRILVRGNLFATKEDAQAADAARLAAYRSATS